MQECLKLYQNSQNKQLLRQSKSEAKTFLFKYITTAKSCQLNFHKIEAKKQYSFLYISNNQLFYSAPFFELDVQNYTKHTDRKNNQRVRKAITGKNRRKLTARRKYLTARFVQQRIEKVCKNA